MPPSPEPLPYRSEFLIRWFVWYVRRYQLRPAFTAVRLACDGNPQPLPPGAPLVVALNHASWWDPLICVVPMDMFPGRRYFAPIDAAMLEKYGLFKKLGFFGVEQGSARGAARFLKTSQAILAQPDTALWITAQGTFADVRTRPVVLRPGLGHLLHRQPGVHVLPLAMEYTFWNEKRPEVLLRFGTPVVSTGREQSAEYWTNQVASALTEALDQLATAAQSRDPGRFRTLWTGTRGISGVYDAWRRLTHRFRGQRFEPGHAPEPADSE